MFTNKFNSQAVITNKRVSKLPHALAIMSTSLMIGLSMASMSAQAAGLGELFANNGAAKSKFLPVDKAFQVISSTKATSKGTRLSINFDIFSSTLKKLPSNNCQKVVFLLFREIFKFLSSAWMSQFS